MPNSTPFPPATRREKFAWCMYDFANSGYTTVVLTTIFSAYFVSTVARDESNPTLLWTLAMAAANGIVLLLAPILGAIADYSAAKKRFLIISTIGCVLFTALLSRVGPGDTYLAMTLVILATSLFAIGETLVAAFLPEISPPTSMGRLSGYGWTIGYIGGLITLCLCFIYIEWSKSVGKSTLDIVPDTNIIVAIVFALAALPTFLWLRERATPIAELKSQHYFSTGYRRVISTLQHAKSYQDLFRFLIALIIFHSGINTVIILAAIYAQEVMSFSVENTVILIIVVNISAAAGALIFGHLQDKIGSKYTLTITLYTWIISVSLIAMTSSSSIFWLAANLVGIALGSSQSASRAFIGQLTPKMRNAEFFGLWGLATKTAAILGPLSYALINHLFQGNHRISILFVVFFFIVGILLLARINEPRGKEAAIKHSTNQQRL